MNEDRHDGGGNSCGGGGEDRGRDSEGVGEGVTATSVCNLLPVTAVLLSTYKVVFSKIAVTTFTCSYQGCKHDVMPQ